MPRGEAMLARGLELPLHFARFRLERIEIAVVALDVDAPIDDGGRGDDTAAGAGLPHLLAGLRAHRIHGVIAAAEVDDAVSDGRRGEHRRLSLELPLHAGERGSTCTLYEPTVLRVTPKHRTL